MAADRNSPFARRLKAEREARGWSQRELTRRAGLSTQNTAARAELGHEVYLSAAVAFATALAVPLSVLAGPFRCGQCADFPPPGFTCQACGANGPEAPGA
jgi:transcriptional regulator with XRE-family HTH domain